MQHGALFGGIDLAAIEHALDSGGEFCLPGQVDEQFSGLEGDAIL